MIEFSDAVILATILCWTSLGMTRAHTLWQWLLVILPFAGVGGYVAYSFRIGGLRSFYRGQMEKYVDAVHIDPANVAARQYLADTLYKLGELDQAIDEMKAAVDMGAGIECEYTLAAWQRERHVRDTLYPYCRICLIDYPRGTRACKKCGSHLSYQNSLSRWLSGGSTHGIRYYILLLFGVALVGVSVLLLPLKYALIPSALLLAAMIGWSLISSAR
ncbi:tetratricopeptide repeat protein [bacterium]|nr:tetratricopeptide repeat protein [bacterium]